MQPDTRYALSRYQRFTRGEWARLRADTPLSLTEEDLTHLRGLNDRVSLDEVVEVYLPLSRLLNLHIGASQGLHFATATFLNTKVPKAPHLLGLAGSVAVGKSTTARIMRALLARWPNHPKVDLVATDGFLYPRRVLEERGIMRRKGFPESYDLRALITFLSAVKAGQSDLAVPVYSHLTYDTVPGQFHIIDQPDVLIVEGLNILQAGDRSTRPSQHLFASDFFDFTVYVDAEVSHIRRWYIERFFALRKTVFQDPSSYFHRYADLTDDEAETVAAQIWRDINEPNLLENILPTRERAHLILEKGPNHSVEHVRLRKL
ncbi:MAG: type I pantothenate kinase [Candidatus Rokubacteria bacterium]|nr:type I pantothenate kinase [Candidatus Rokubacteria bacterium]